MTCRQGSANSGANSCLYVSKAIVMFLQKAWGIRNAYKHGTPVVDVFESASERHGPDGIDARA
jgi:hypothetical protein